jgi:4-hydroxythreonine-4-phosphate dehydrogenase
MGCPVGIGPEIAVRFLTTAAAPPAVVVGDPLVLEGCVRQWAPGVVVREWQQGQPVAAGAINVLPVSRLAGLAWGRPDEHTGRAMARYIEEAVRLVRAGELSALVTCPITKTALRLAGYAYPGHTEMLADLCRSENFGMMLAGDRLVVSLVTIHTALARVAGLLRQGEVERLIRLTGLTLGRDFGLATPRMAVAGLNPHAGEGGMFGREEEKIILPAVEAARGEGWQVIGPLPPDTVFCRAAQGEFDAVVCMYHDQGLIPFKLLHFADGVNVTMGLPMIRTSVDHGTAYDIAGTGRAEYSSLAAACNLAARMVRNREHWQQGCAQ